MEHTALTIGELARQTGVERYQIAYILNKLGIEPMCRAGRVRVFAPEALEEIREELAARRYVG